MYSGLLKTVGTKPVCFSPMCNAFLLTCPALLAQAYAGNWKALSMEQLFWKLFYVPYLAGSIYDEQIYGYEYLGVFRRSACSVPTPIATHGTSDSHHQCSPNKRAVAAPRGSATTSPMTAPKQDQDWAL